MHVNNTLYLIKKIYMKTINFKNNFFYLFVLLGLIISLNGCSSDDETTKTFLEKYDGTSWLVPISEETVYIRINDDLIKFIEEWEYYESNDCYEYEDHFFEEGTFEVIENSENKLIVEYNYEGDTETLTLTVQGDTLKVVVDYSFDGETGQEILFLTKSSINVDDLVICSS